MKAIAVFVLFTSGVGMASIAAYRHEVTGVAVGMICAGIAIGYLLGRVDLRHELGIPHQS